MEKRSDVKRVPMDFIGDSRCDSHYCLVSVPDFESTLTTEGTLVGKYFHWPTEVLFEERVSRILMRISRGSSSVRSRFRAGVKQAVLEISSQVQALRGCESFDMLRLMF